MSETIFSNFVVSPISKDNNNPNKNANLMTIKILILNTYYNITNTNKNISKHSTSEEALC
jgi:hypothetical protein